MKLGIKQCILLAALAVLPGSGFAALYSATGAGVSTVGTGGDYLTLGDAAAAINAAGTRDASQWILEIVSDTTEASNFGIKCTIAVGGEILIRPAAATQPTVTFTATVDNAGASGHFIIGGTPAAGWDLGSTNGVTIDGSNNGTNTRDLTFQNTAANAHSFSSIIAIVGATSNTTIRNCRVINLNAAAVGSVSGISVRPRNQTATDFIPTNFQIINNEISSAGSQQGVAINITNSGTLAAGNAPNGFLIQGNDLTARIRGIFVNPGYGYTIEDNDITVTGIVGFDTYGIFQNSSNTPPAYTSVIRNNRFVTSSQTAAAAANGPWGINFGTAGTGYDRVAEIYNNTIVLSDTGARNAGTNPNIRGIVSTSSITSRIYNNSIYIPDNPNKLGAPTGVAAYAIGGYAVAAYNSEVLNNIVVVEYPNVGGISQNTAASGAGSGFVSDRNIIHVANGAVTGRQVGTVRATLADWRTNTGQDANSDDFSPLADFVSAVAPFDLSLTAGTRSIAGWGATPLALVTTDNAGTARNATNPYRGAFELATALTNTAPSAVAVTPSAIDENSANATVVGAVSATDPDQGDSITWSLLNNGGGAFALSGTNIVVADSSLLNFEAAASINIELRATDEVGAQTDQIIAITINDVNEAPTDITLTGDTVLETDPVGTVVGALASVDEDAGQTHTYALVAGAGDTDNALFAINGSNLEVNAALTPGTKSIRISTTDNGTPNLSFEKEFQITVNPTSVGNWMILNEQ